MEREQREQQIKDSVVKMASTPVVTASGRGSPSEKEMTEASKALAEKRRKAKEYREMQNEIYKHTVSQI